MAKKNLTRAVVRRRGTSIAAAALSVALVAPFVHPVVSRSLPQRRRLKPPARLLLPRLRTRRN